MENLLNTTALHNNVSTSGDSYKNTHGKTGDRSDRGQYPPETDYISDYVEARSGEVPYTIHFGTQMLLEKLSTPLTMADVEETCNDIEMHIPGFVSNREGWRRVVNNHGGYLPIEISTLPEGGMYPLGTPLVVVENIDPEMEWATGFSETPVLRGTWYPNTVCTYSFGSKIDILEALVKSSDEDPWEAIKFKLHDFGARGVSSQESAEIGGAAHLVNFYGTDTFEALRQVRRIYGEQMAGYSIVAAEHSTITTWRRGQQTNETAAYRNMLKFAKPGGLVAVVSDSYDLWAAIELWGTVLKAQLLASGATIVIRPDSGDPLTVPIKAIEMLGNFFGYTVNKKGYKVLPPNVRVIQGDGINRHSIRTIIKNLLDAKWSMDNLAFGQGGALLQNVTRDDFGFAMKAWAINENGVWHDVYKDPATDSKKRSKRGRHAVIMENGIIKPVPLIGNEHRNLLKPVWRAGETLYGEKFTDVRQRANDAARITLNQRLAQMAA